MATINNIGVEPAHLTRALISRLNGPVIEVRPGLADDEWDKLEKKIVDELRFRQKEGGDRTPNADGLTANEWLRTTLYGLILVWLNDEDDEFLAARVPRRMLNSAAIASNPAAVFHHSIAAVFAANPKLINASDRARLAAPMWYAFRHYIPPELLLGFNHQYPAHRAPDRSRLNELESPLLGWIKEQRLYSRWRGRALDEYRGAYPSDIEDFVAAAVNEFY